MDPRPDSSVHLWVYNHPFYAVSDQIEFFLSIMRQHGYAATVSGRPRIDALNVVIENFNDDSSGPLIDFCRSSRKRVAVIMTEHIDFIGGDILFHGSLMGTQNDYLTSGAQGTRLKNLMDCSQYIRCFVVLGDVPELLGISRMFPGIAVRTLPFPQLQYEVPRKPARIGSVSSDLVFTGYCTQYRHELLDRLEREMSVVCPRKWVSRRVRDNLNCSSRIALNLPQRRNWKWLSLMRIIGALRCGRATVSLGTSDSTRISACCAQLDINSRHWLELLRHHIADWQGQFQEALQRYTAMAVKFERERPFPHDLFDCWRTTETTWSKRTAA